MEPPENKKRRKLRAFRDVAAMRDYAKDVLVDEGEIASELCGVPAPGRFLDLYAEPDLRKVLERFGVVSVLYEKGFESLTIEMRSDNPLIHRFRVLNEGAGDPELLMELALEKKAIPANKLHLEAVDQTKLEVLFVDWLLLQNPREAFGDRLCLPGQRFPGLGLAKELLQVIEYFCRQLKFYAILAIPGHYHNALIFSRYFRYIDPVSEGRLRALRRDLSAYPLAVASWAVELNCVCRHPSGEAFKWYLDWQLLPVRGELEAHFSSHGYRSEAERVVQSERFFLDREKFERERLKIPKLEEVVI